MIIGDLFSGIGGFSLAARWMGWSTAFTCETNQFCQRILRHHFPEADHHGDIRSVDWSRYRGAVDLVSGGFPCQPFSVAGKRAGKKDDRFLWPEMLKAIRDILPTFVVAENVRGIINIEGGMVFEQVLSDLESAGYETVPWLIPAAGVGAPHRRERVWIIGRRASTDSESVRGRRTKGNGEIQGEENRGQVFERPQRLGSERAIADSGFKRRNKGGDDKERDAGRDEVRDGTPGYGNYIPKWENFPTVPAICRGDDGISGRLDGITVAGLRNKGIEALGNAIVPQVAYDIFKAIEESEMELW